jgi:hypothetical protein
VQETRFRYRKLQETAAARWPDLVRKLHSPVKLLGSSSWHQVEEGTSGVPSWILVRPEMDRRRGELARKVEADGGVWFGKLQRKTGRGQRRGLYWRRRTR